MARKVALVLLLLVSVAGSLSPAQAIHFYRSTDGGCSDANGEVTDDPEHLPRGPVTATVAMHHNLFVDDESDSSETRIKVGEAVKWTWNSAHCHSAETSGPGFDSGYRYPTTAPSSPRVVPGFFEYPLLEEDATLWFVHTFRTPGTFEYFCVHHQSIGMSGTVIVE